MDDELNFKSLVFLLWVFCKGQVISCFLGGASGKKKKKKKNTPANAGNIRNAGLILGQEDLLKEGNLLQYSCLENTNGQRSLAGYSP